MIFDWPLNVIPQAITILPPRKTAGLSTSQSEFSQSVPVIRPPFGLVMEFGNIFGDEVTAYRALLASFEGRTNRVRVPLFDLWFTATDAQIGAGSVTHTDGTGFSDGAVYTTTDIEGVLVSGVQGQRIITADFGEYGQLLQAGLYFGLGEHPYIAQTATWDGSVATIACSPTLRRDYVDQPLKLKPTMIAGLTSDDGGQIKLQRGRFGSPTLELVERFDEPLY